jgi:hypothetical protein
MNNGKNASASHQKTSSLTNGPLQKLGSPYIGVDQRSRKLNNSGFIGEGHIMDSNIRLISNAQASTGTFNKNVIASERSHSRENQNNSQVGVNTSN